MGRESFSWDSLPVKKITMTQPALGADYAVAETIVPAGKRWLLIAVYLPVDTSGAAEWYPKFAVDAGAAAQRVWYDAVTIAAAAHTTVCSIGTYSMRVVAGTMQFVPIPLKLELPATYAFRVTGTTADDRWGTGYFFYKEAPA